MLPRITINKCSVQLQCSSGLYQNCEYSFEVNKSLAFSLHKMIFISITNVSAEPTESLACPVSCILDIALYLSL